MNHRFILVLLALVGLVSAGQLTGARMISADACPSLGPVPACYLVFAGYLLILISAVLTGWARHLVFLLAWLPVLALALIASVLEVMRGSVCPTGFASLPQCYLSAALALAIGWAWISGMMSWQKTKKLGWRTD